jgi:hypothetical protein
MGGFAAHINIKLSYPVLAVFTIALSGILVEWNSIGFTQVSVKFSYPWIVKIRTGGDTR